MQEYRKLIFILVIVFVALRPIINYLTDKSIYRGSWYSVKVPKGWNSKFEKNTIYFSTPDDNVLTGMPNAIFSIYAFKSTGALFLDTLFEEVMQSLMKTDGQILKKGEIMIDGQVAKWVLFQNETPPTTILTFFMVDDFNRLTKIQFITHPRDFAKYRPEFEKWRETFKFKKTF